MPAVIAAVTLAAAIGCGQFSYRLSKKSAPDTYVPNPIELPPTSDQFVWSQVVDSVDDYFHIAREQPVQNSDGIILDGRIETAYKIGSSVLEPWGKDSTAGFERLQSTLQSIRRRAIVIVRPKVPPTPWKSLCKRTWRIPTAAKMPPKSVRYNVTTERCCGVCPNVMIAPARWAGFRWAGTLHWNR